MTVECPLDCEYLQQAHEFERPEMPPAEMPHSGIEISAEFLEEHEGLLSVLSAGIGMAAEQTPGAADADVREALAALSETYLTLDKGVVYEHVPQNRLAAHIFRRAQEAIAQIRQAGAGRGERRTRDGEVLRALVFLERVAVDRNNGRKHGRPFLAMLRRLHTREVAPPTASSMLLLP